ncbi:hypothetical protein BKK56_04980 [Rodentibacter genomosp. 2]|uniref:WG repeat-containing protein n=1 Tax=Rodentibacter genomosp. 2 TaxID=1908266 RepID=UPI000986D2C5|nr:hypothetical protein BKK56_04980 [Rodentibacter genomosp. 2]
MKNTIAKLSLPFLCFYLAACDTVNPITEPSLDEQKADVLVQFEQCHQLQSFRPSQQKQLIETCQKPLISKLADIENQLYRKAYGEGYSQLEPYEKGYWYGVKNNLIGILDNQGQVVIEPKYSDMGILRTKPNYNSYLYYSKHTLPDPMRHYFNVSELPTVNYFYPVVYFVDEQGNWGAINIETKAATVPFKYQEAHYVGSGYVELIERDLKTGEEISRVLVNQQGEAVLDPRLYDQYSFLGEDYIQVQKDQKYGIVKNNREIIPTISEKEFEFYDGLLIIDRWRTGETRIYSPEGKLIELPKNYRLIDGFSKDSQIMSVINDKNKQHSIWTKSGKKLFDHLLKAETVGNQYIQISKGKNLASYENYKSALLDLNGNMVLDYKYTEFNIVDIPNNPPLIETRLIEDLGILDNDLKELIPITFRSISYNAYEDEFNVSTHDNLEGIYSTAGKVIFEPAYKRIENSYYSPVKIVTRGDKIALFSLTGKAITDFRYETDKIKALNNDKLKEFFPDGAIIVKQGDAVGIINNAGQTVLPFEYQDLDFIDDYQVFQFKQKDKWGLIAPSGEVIIAAQYDDLKMHNPQQYLVRIGKKSGAINLKGEIIIPIDYDWVYSLRNGDDDKSEKETSRFFSVEKNGLWGVWDVVENKQIISNSFPSENFYTEQGEFTNIYRNRNIIANREGHSSAIYAQRQRDNQEQYGFVPAAPITISENALVSGKRDYKKLVNYFYQVEINSLKKGFQLERKLAEFYLDDISSLTTLFDDYINHLKEIKSGIENLKITDPEVKYLANQFLAYNFMRIQYQEEYKKYAIETKNSGIDSEEKLISLEKNYKRPVDTAEWEMNKIYILLKQKYNKFYQSYGGKPYTHYHYNGYNYLQYDTSWLFEDIG